MLSSLAGMVVAAHLEEQDVSHVAAASRSSVFLRRLRLPPLCRPSFYSDLELHAANFVTIPAFYDYMRNKEQDI